MQFLKAQKLLCIAVAMIILGSVFANMFNTSFYDVNVSPISFETAQGRLEGLLYMPRDAGPNNPRPVIVTTHGYLNSAEMQDLTAIELSRRGFIVMAMHMYDHGESRWAGDIPVGGQFATFWIHAQWSAVQWAYQQPWTLRDANGNGMIGVTGHSMGGFSTTTAIFFDELQSLQSGIRMIYAGLPVGADMSFAAAVAPMDQLLAAYGSRTVGFVAGLWDEFFFNNPADTAAAGGTVQRADWTEVPAGMMFLGLDPAGQAGRAGQWYQANSGELVLGDNVVRGSEIGNRIIFTPNEIHPWNHFSATSVAHIVSFFDVVMGSPNHIAPGNQIWQWKVLFNFITLIGYFLLVVPVAGLLIKLPFFKLAITEENAPVPMGDKPYSRFVFWLALIIGTAIPAYLIPMLMERREDELSTLGIIALVLGGICLVGGIVSFVVGKGSKPSKIYGVGGVITAIIFGVIWLIAANPDNIVDLSPFFMAPAVNAIGYWAVMSGVIALLVLAIMYFLSRRHLGAGLKNYGLVARGAAIPASLAVAICTLVILYVIVFIMQAIFVVDGRIWTLAIRAMSWEGFLSALRYMPVFLVFYFINTIAVNANSQGRKAGWLIAILMNVGGVVVWLALQYGILFATGVAMYPTMALNAILLIGLAPCLGIAAVYAYKLFQKTNNVYLGAFINTMLFTLIVLVNTAVFWNMV